MKRNFRHRGRLLTHHCILNKPVALLNQINAGAVEYFVAFSKKILFCYSGFCTEDEERLVRDLFRGYNKYIRPTRNMTDKVHVNFGLTFVQLINVDEKNQVMKSNVWLELHWHDYQLQWDPSDYQGIQKLRIPSDKIWKPDIVLFNNADGKYEVRYKSNIIIFADGNIQWVPPALYQSSCTIDVTYFPFDQQTCLMKFGSWIYNGDQVSLGLLDDKNYVSLSDYSKSGTWDIIELPAYLNVYSEPNAPTETDITFYITIRRKTLFYTVNLIVPIIMVSFLVIGEFYLPAEAGEKVTLGISILLSLVLFLLLVSKILPPTSLVLPLIAKYLLFIFLMNLFVISMTVIVINWNFRGPKTHRMPSWMRLVFLKYLPTILFMQRPKKTRLRWMMERGNSKYNNRTNKNVVPISAEHAAAFSESRNNQLKAMELIEMNNIHLQNHHHPNCNVSQGHLPNNIPNTYTHNDSDDIYETVVNRRQSELGRDLEHPMIKETIQAVDFLAEHLKNEDLYIQTREDWRYVAKVFDRMLLWAFFLFTAASSASILLSAPHIFSYVDQDEIIRKYQ
ncbi:Similar to nAChRbeta1: Acetylcholine receptor subunit beta-like 1 (Drosophila melanogaster) [Cotesia congregata]|uniref:Similar to nAChRbeta1: Acetylcholine receptor subunit beta-like 1 (Drosophila melanogaster) n=1 Tax=Cotesia congregata TaxID=51543 RepID=A0A8J2MHS3_COTCN|nr:Similar to nAChRbeta1: Acetylcholine receptor subunit beta-like 1 (Drosophila melanogaster) [Cotesia congregata]